MTQEEKAKAHDEALKVIKKCVPDENGFITIYPQEIFPELNEDEDDKIKQRIIKLIKMSSEVGGFALHKWEADEMLDWLEKQKQKSIDPDTLIQQRVDALADIVAEQKPAGSEEDEKILNDLLWIIEAFRKNGFNEIHKYMADKSETWLKSLKERMKGK